MNVNVPCPRGRWTTPHTRVSCTLPCLQVDEILHTLSWTKPSRSPRPPPADRRPASLWSPAHRNWSIWTRLLTPNWQIQQKQSGELQNDLKSSCDNEIWNTAQSARNFHYAWNMQMTYFFFFKCAVCNKAHYMSCIPQCNALNLTFQFQCDWWARSHDFTSVS